MFILHHPELRLAACIDLTKLHAKWESPLMAPHGAASRGGCCAYRPISKGNDQIKKILQFEYFIYSAYICNLLQRGLVLISETPMTKAALRDFRPFLDILIASFGKTLDEHHSFICWCCNVWNKTSQLYIALSQFAFFCLCTYCVTTRWLVVLNCALPFCTYQKGQHFI